MRIRVEGTEAEIATVVEQITTVLNVQETSRFYANRGSSVLGRVYLTVTAPTAGAMLRAEAERTDEPHRLPRGSRKEIR